MARALPVGVGALLCPRLFKAAVVLDPQRYRQLQAGRNPARHNPEASCPLMGLARTASSIRRSALYTLFIICQPDARMLQVRSASRSIPSILRRMELYASCAAFRV